MGLTGQEFNNMKGTQGGLLKWIWAHIYVFINSAVAAVDLSNFYTKTETDTAIGDAVAAEATARQAAIVALESELTNYDTSSEVSSKISTAISELVDGAPIALDTLKELATLLTSNSEGDSSTLTALNALITTVDGKVGQESFDELASTVGGLADTLDGKADITSVNDVLDKTKSIIAAIIQKVILKKETFMITFNNNPYFQNSNGGVFTFQGFGALADVNGIFNQNGLLLKGAKVYDIETMSSMFTADPTLDYMYEADLEVEGFEGKMIKVVFNPDLSISPTESGLYRMLISQQVKEELFDIYPVPFDATAYFAPNGEIEEFFNASV